MPVEEQGSGYTRRFYGRLHRRGTASGLVDDAHIGIGPYFITQLIEAVAEGYVFRIEEIARVKRAGLSEVIAAGN